MNDRPIFLDAEKMSTAVSPLLVQRPSHLGSSTTQNICRIGPLTVSEKRPAEQESETLRSVLDGSQSAPGDRGFSRRFENVPDLGFSLPLLRFLLYSYLLQRIQ